MPETQTELAIAQHEYVRHYIAQADSKSALGLISTSALLVWSAQTYFSLIVNSGPYCILRLLSILILLTVSAAVLSFTCALWPRMPGKGETGLFFYSDVAGYENHGEFVKEYKSKETECFNDEVLKSIYHSSKICRKKFSLIRCGIFLGIVSTFLIGLSFTVKEENKGSVKHNAASIDAKVGGELNAVGSNPHFVTY